MRLHNKSGFNLIRINILLGFISKFGSFILSYLSLPIALSYLGVNYYGVWVVIFSVVSWIYNFDVGVGLGLKNSLNDSFVKKDVVKSNELIATSYIILIIISLFILIISSVFILFFDINKILNITSVSEEQVKLAILVSIFFTITNFVILLYKQLFSAVNQSGFAGMTTIFYQLAVIVLLLIAKLYFSPSLLIVSIIYGASNLIVGVFFTIIFFKKNPDFDFKFSNFRSKYISTIGGVGIKFFIIQMCMVIIFTTDNILISKFLGAEFVTSYSLILKTYQAFIMISYIILTPYWTLFSESFFRNDVKWIIRQYKKIYLLFIAMIISLVIYSYFIDPLLRLWLRFDLQYNAVMIYGFCAFVIVRVFIDIHAVLLNGLGRINIQLALYILASIINIPLSIFLIKFFQMKSEAVIIATTVAILPMAFILPIQVFNLLKKKNDEGYSHNSSI